MKTSTSFEQAVKRNKRLQLIKGISFSLISMLVVLGLGYKGLTMLTARSGNAVKERYLLMSEIAYPNVSYTNWYFEPTSAYTGKLISDRLKSIDGISVPYESVSLHYSLQLKDDNDSKTWLVPTEDMSAAYTSANHYKSPLFYNPKSLNKVKPTQDVTLLEQMPNQATEMALTFDKPYSYKEIQNLLPDNIRINWYWIGTSGTFDTSFLKPDTQLGVTADKDGLSQQSVAQFKANLKTALEKQYLSKSYGSSVKEGEKTVFSLESDAKKFLKEAPKDWKDTRFLGVIVSGKTENLAQLADNSAIYASNIGQSVTIQPYDKLEK